MRSKVDLGIALSIQENDLSFWKKRLNNSYYCALVEECAKRNINITYKDGDKVFRGNDMTIFIQNLSL